MSDKLKLTIERNAEGDVLVILMDGDSGMRIAGPKAWGGATVLHSFDIKREDLESFINTDTLRTELSSTKEEVERLREALSWFFDRRFPIQSKFNLHGPEDTARAMKKAFIDAGQALSQGKDGA